MYVGRVACHDLNCAVTMDPAPVRRQLVWPRSENPMLLMAPLLTHKNRKIESTNQAHIHSHKCFDRVGCGASGHGQPQRNLPTRLHVDAHASSLAPRNPVRRPRPWSYGVPSSLNSGSVHSPRTPSTTQYPEVARCQCVGRFGRFGLPDPRRQSSVRPQSQTPQACTSVASLVMI